MQSIGIPELIVIVVNLLTVLVVLGIILGLAAWVVLALARRGQGQVAGQTPLDILRMRYAKGELTKEQFESMKRDIIARTE